MAGKIEFSDVFDELKAGVISLAKSTVSDYLADAKKDGTQILQTLKDELKTWTDQLVSGDLTEDDFKWLVLAKKDSLKMAALEKEGLALVKIDQFKSSVLNLVVDTVLKLI